MLQYLTLFIDLDGVLADFDKHFHQHHNKFFREFGDEEAWTKLKEIPDFWLDLDPMFDAFELWNRIKTLHIPIVLLSSPGSHDEHRARFQKRLWVDKHLGRDVPLILCAAKDKCKFAGKDRVLIDDMNLNIDQWVNHGGHGILHVSAEDSLSQLRQIEANCRYLNWLKEFADS